MSGRKLFGIIFGAIVAAQLFVAVVSAGVTLLFAKGIIDIDETQPSRIEAPRFRSEQVAPNN